MLTPRWKKVFQDLLSNKTRTLLTMLSISVGVFAVGVNAAIGGIVVPDVKADYDSVNAHVAIIYCGTFDDTLLTSVRQVKGISEAEGRSHLDGQLVAADGSRQPISLTGIPAIKEMKIDQLKGTDGLPEDLGKKQIYFERSTESLGYHPGDLVAVELPDGKIKQLLFKGYVHDVATFPYAFAGTLPAYVSPETIEWLGGTRQYSQLLISVAENRTDKTHVANMANAVSDKLKKGGINVDSIFIYSPGKHFSTDIFVAIMAILNMLGWLTVFLSAFLVINTINSLMAQHIKQIGIMKSIGGSSNQITVMYLTLIMVFGLFSFLLAAPLSGFAGYQVCVFMANFINFDLRGFRFIPEAFVLQALIAFIVPTLAALLPVLNGVRMSVREAVFNYGNQIGFGSSRVDRLLKKVRFLSRPLAISLRNSIRRKGRLLLTLSTLTLGGAIFMAVFNLWAAFGLTIEQIEGYFMADVNITLSRPYREQRVKDIVMQIPGVSGFEAWKSCFGQVQSTDGKSEVEIAFYAPPLDSTLIKPILTEGRWLAQGDENAVVIGNHLIKERPDLKVGDDMIIKVKEHDTSFHVVGIYRMAGNVTPPILYTTPDYLSKISDAPGEIYEVRVITAEHSLAAETRVAELLQERFRQENMPVSYVRTGILFRQQQESQTDVMIYFLLVMAVLIALVGGLGLMGAMGMNVMERIREIGVMRAIGASNRDIEMIVIAEGLLVGLVSWGLGLALSFPLTYVLNTAVGISMFNSPLSFSYSLQGTLGWLGGVLLLAALASLMPAWNASRMTIREVLAYE